MLEKERERARNLPCVLDPHSEENKKINERARAKDIEDINRLRFSNEIDHTMNEITQNDVKLNFAQEENLLGSWTQDIKCFDPNEIPDFKIEEPGFTDPKYI